MVVLALVPLVSLLGLQATTYFQDHKAREMRANEEYAEAISMAFGRYVDSLWAAEAAMGAAVVLQRGEADPERTGRFLSEQLAAHTAVARFLWLDPGGVVVACTDRRACGLNFAAKGYVQHILQGGEASISPLMRSKATGQPVVAVARGIRLDGQLRGILIATLDVTSLDQVLPVSRGDGRSFGLVDANGMIVYDSADPYLPMEERYVGNLSPAAEALQGQTTAENRIVNSRDQVDLMGVATPVPAIGWAAYAAAPVGQVTADAIRRAAPYVVAGVLVDLGTAGLIYWLVHRMLRPVLALQRAARAISQGDLSARVHPEGSDEIAAAARTFDQMAERIQQSEAQLRTRALQQGAVASLGLAALEGVSPSQLMAQAIDLLREVLRVKFCKVLELQPGGDQMRLVAGCGWSDGVVGTAMVPATPQSQAGFTLQAREPVIVTDLLRETRFDAPALLREHGVISGMSVIIPGPHHPYGVLGVHTAAPRSFTQDDVHFLQAVANVVATAMERAEAQRLLAVQYRVARALAEAGSMAEGLSRVLQALCQGMRWEMGLFWLPDAEDGGLRCHALWRDPSFPASRFEAETRRAVLPLGEVSPWPAAGGAFCWHTGDPLDLSPARGEAVAHDGIRTICGFPVMAENLLGLIELDSAEIREADPGLTGLMQMVGGLVAQFVERKRAEAALQQVNAALEQRVAERTAELASANQELEAFSYSASHDLQGPLRTISGFAQALQEDAADRLTPGDREYLRRILGAVSRMSQLIKDMLRLSRATRQEMHRQEVDLTAMAWAVAGELRRLYPRGTETAFLIQEGLRGNADGGLLYLALFNLMANAWKFASRRDAPTIQVGMTQVDGESAYFVRDNGVGFDMAQADQLFVPFKRLHSGAAYEGSGVGLAIVQRVVHRHGGRVWAKSREGQGATFFFTLGSGQFAKSEAGGGGGDGQHGSSPAGSAHRGL